MRLCINSGFYVIFAPRTNHPMKQLFPLLTPYKRTLAAIGVCNVISVIFSILSLLILEPFLQLMFQKTPAISSGWLNRVLSRFISGQDSTQTLFYLIAFAFLFFLLTNVTAYASQWFMADIRSGVVRNLRAQIHKKLLILPLSFYSREKKGDLISRAINDTQEIELNILRAFQQLFREPVAVLIYLITLFIISFKLTLFVLILLPVAGLIIGKISKTLRRKSVHAKEKMGLMSSLIEESIAGLRIVKAFVAIEWMNRLFKQKNEDYTRLQIKIGRRYNLASPTSEFLGTFVVLIILLYGGNSVLNGTENLSPEKFMTYIAIFIMVINPAKTLSVAAYNLKKGMASLDRINFILNAEEVIIEEPDALPLSDLKNTIEFKNVCFSYGDKEVLTQVNYTLEKGKSIALCGQSGSGKSTLMDLLQRFYDVSEGAILWDGISLKKYKIDDLRAQTAVVSQDVILFNDTVFNNIAFGLKNVSEEAVIAAAKTAHAYDFIMDTPNGFETVLGDRGLTLSGGQRQRLSIARAILKDAPVLILDEATSAMDSESEKILQEAIFNIGKNKTLITIAHRLSTIQNVDEIIMLENGTIVETGTPQALANAGGYYAKYINGSKL